MFWKIRVKNSIEPGARNLLVVIIVVCIPLQSSLSTYTSLTRWFSFESPMYSDNSWNKILIKIRLELVVSSSLSFMHDKTSQDMESVNNKWAKNFDTFRNLFVSKRCMVSYESLKICSNGVTYILLIAQKR